MGNQPRTPRKPTDPARASDVGEEVIPTVELPCKQYYKLAVVGDAGVGSSSFCCRFHGGTFPPAAVPGGPCCWWTRCVEVDSEKVLVELWDLKSTSVHGSRARFPSRRSLTAGTHGVLFLYSAIDRQSFEHVHIWIQHMQKLCGEDVKKLVVATKCDLVNDVGINPFSVRYGYHHNHQSGGVDYFAAKQYADSQGISLIETSSKDNVNIELAVLTLIAQIRS